MSFLAILKSVLLIVEVLAAFLLVVVILAQKSKDQGLGMAFGSGMGESLFGSRAGNVLTRMTITLATVFMLTTIVLGVLFARGKSGSGSVMDRAASQPMAPTAPMAPAQAPAPMMPSDEPVAMPVEAPSAPVELQMGEGGELAPVEAPVAEVSAEAAPAAEPAAEGEPAPQD